MKKWKIADERHATLSEKGRFIPTTTISDDIS